MTGIIQNSQTYYIFIFCDVSVCCPFPLASKTLNLSSKTCYLPSSTGKQSSWARNEPEPPCVVPDIPKRVYGDLVYKLKKIVGSDNFSAQFIKIIFHYKRLAITIMYVS